MICPQPRPRNAAATRAGILDAARDRFVAHSYDDVGVRDIARDAGVDPALVNRYFGSKEDLFAAVLDSCDEDKDTDFWEDRAGFGLRIANDLVYERRADKMRRLLIVLRSLGSARALEVVRNGMTEHFMAPFQAWIGRPDAAVRVHLAAGLILGMSVTRELGDGFDMTPAECEALRDRLAATLQGFIDD